jgi:hypothetical protein
MGGNKKENDLTKENLKGKVKELTETNFNAKKVFGDLEKDGLASKYQYKYDVGGNMTERSYSNGDGAEYPYMSSSTFLYDNNGNKTESSSYDEDGNIRYNDKYKYDEDGNMTAIYIYDKDGELDGIYKYKYDVGGNMTEFNYISIKLELDWIYKYKYDVGGNKTECAFGGGDGGVKSNLSKYKYDEDGNETECATYDEDGELEYKDQYKYDEFDKKNNWIVRTKYRNDTPTAIEEREIEYY